MVRVVRAGDGAAGGIFLPIPQASSTAASSPAVGGIPLGRVPPTAAASWAIGRRSRPRLASTAREMNSASSRRAAEMRVLPMAQGQKQSRIVAWWF